MAQAPRDVVVVTGASGGIGADLARLFARRGHDLVLVARSADKLQALAAEIADPQKPAPIVLELDLERREAADELVAALHAQNARCSILVNNAGYGLAGKVATLGRAAQIGMVDLNVRALTDITLALLPNIIEARGRILNVASTAAFYAGPGLAVYYATKAFVLSFSEALNFELRGRGVSVTALCPGPTATGFQDRARLDAPLFNMMTPMGSMPVAQAGYDGLMAGRRVVVPGLFNKFAVWMSRIVPRGLSMHATAWLQETRRHD